MMNLPEKYLNPQSQSCIQGVSLYSMGANVSLISGFKSFSGRTVIRQMIYRDGSLFNDSMLTCFTKRKMLFQCEILISTITAVLRTRKIQTIAVARDISFMHFAFLFLVIQFASWKEKALLMSLDVAVVYKQRTKRNLEGQRFGNQQ